MLKKLPRIAQLLGFSMLGQLKRRYSARALARQEQLQHGNLASKISDSPERFPAPIEQTQHSNAEPIHKASVQCSACNTRFSVPEEFSDLNEELRFHCPRCNNVFCSTVLRLTTKPETINFPDGQVLNQKQEFDNTANNTNDSEVDCSEVAHNSISNDTYIEAQEVAEIVKAQKNPVTTTASSFVTSQTSFDFSAPVYSSQHNENSSASKASAANQIQMPFMFELQTKKVRESKESQFRNFLNNITLKQSVNVRIPEAPQLAAESSSIEQVASFNHNQLTATSAIRQVLSRVTPFLTPGIACLLILGTLSIFGQQSAALRSEIRSRLIPGAIQVAPAGLFIDQLESKKVTLESGEEMTLISGKVINNTARNFRNLRLEVIAFDSAGQTIETLRAESGKTLTDSKIRALNSEAIKRIQSRPERTVIKSGQSKDFELGLFAQDYHDLSFYNARIFSVNYN
jgi:hypothetical protein